MAEIALSAYRGDRMVYIGEGPWTPLAGDEPVTPARPFSICTLRNSPRSAIRYSFPASLAIVPP